MEQDKFNTIGDELDSVIVDEKKVYGTSVLDQTDDADDGFEDSPKYTEEEISGMRDELRASKETKVTEKTSTDALSGTRVSTKEEVSIDDIEKSIEANDPKGKTLPEKAVKLVKDLIGVTYTEEDNARLAAYFEEYTANKNDERDVDETFESVNLKDITDALGSEVMKTITALADNTEEVHRIAARFISQIYACYHSAIEYADDMRELTHITRMLKQNGEEYQRLSQEDDNSDPAKGEETLDNVIQAKDWITKWLETRKRIDDRNSRLKQDYRIDDIDTKTVEDVKEALEDAIEMKTITNGILNNAPLMKREFNNVHDSETVIKNWVTAIKNDPHTLYTFPSNDYNTIAKTITDVVDFIEAALIAECFKDHPIPESEADKDPSDYYISIGLMSKKDIDVFYTKAYAVLYTIAKVFKPKKLNDIYNRRVLSYTLDMMSKLGRADYRARFYEFANTCEKYLCE